MLFYIFCVYSYSKLFIILAASDVPDFSTNTVIIAFYHTLQTQQKHKKQATQIIISILKDFQPFIYV